MARLFGAWLVVVGVIAGCGGDDGDSGTADAGVPEGDAGPCSPGWEGLFADDFDDVEGPPFVEGYDALPLALFPEDRSRWTQIQNTNEGENTMAVVDVDGGRALECFAAGLPDPEASKMDVGRDGFAFAAGDRVRLGTRLWFDHSVADVLPSNTLVDLEDSDDVVEGGESAGAGLRIMTDAEGRLTVNRGEIPGREVEGEPAVIRLSTMRSDYVVPEGRWVHVELTLQLGVDVTRSDEVIADFDAETTAAWSELRVREEGEAEARLVLRMAGTNMLDAAALREVVEREDPGADISIAEPITYDALQVGATNNRSEEDVLIRVDDVTVEHLIRCP